MNDISRPPFNPWISCVVEASAGSGKTWQLSRRFLALVMAGADPASILTATFTNKAAAEMRERIIHDAIELGRTDSDKKNEFRGFHAAISAWAPKESWVKIRTPKETSKIIIANTQSLKITTIDALFMQWSQRFPLETALTIDDETLRSPWELLSGKPLSDLHEKAWLDVLAMASDHHENRSLMESISRHAPNGKIKSLTAAITPLTDSDTFIWYARMLQSEEPLKFFPVDDNIPDAVTFLELQSAQLRPLIGRISNTEKRTEALEILARSDMPGLVRLKIVNAGLNQLNGNTFKSAAKNSDPDLMAVNEALAAWSDQRKLESLNHSAQLLWTLYKARTTAAHRRKITDGRGSFADAIKGVSRLACDDRFAGGRAMAWSGIRHLMLDEFQDTSRLQWMIFERLALELLSGESRDARGSEPKATVFIVGDKKQSIYRFREAAPEVLDLAKEALMSRGLLSMTMSDSFRSAAAILDFVNQVFADGTLIPDYPSHQPSAIVTKTSPARFQYGTIAVYDVNDVNDVNDATKSSEAPDAKTDDEDLGASVTPVRQTLSAREREALTVASHIKRCITGDIPVKVFDTASKTWRMPRPRDFAVLYPKSQTAAWIEDALRHQDIPSVRAETKGYFARQEIQDLNALVTWLTWPADTVALCTVLRSPIIGLDDQTLQRLISQGPEALWDQLRRLVPEAATFLARLQHEHQSASLPEIAATLIHDHQVDERYAEAFGPIEGPLAKANIRKWFELTRSASTDDGRSIHQWSKALDEASAEDETGHASTASDAVVMMTIHKSKGLEFPIVIITGTAEDWHTDDTGWIKDSRPGQEGLWYIGTSQDVRPQNSEIMNDLRRLSEEASRAEKSRLLYVALTRASQHLVITGAAPRRQDRMELSFHSLLKSAALQLKQVQKKSITAATDETSGGILLERPYLDASPEAFPSSNDRLEEKIPAPKLTAPSGLGTLAVKILTASASLKSSSYDHDSSDEMSPSTIPEGFASAYGTLVHKLIELQIQDVAITDQALAHILRKESPKPPSSDLVTRLTAAARQEVRELTASAVWQGLLRHARQLHAELPMTGLISEADSIAGLMQAKADLVIVYNDGRVLIVDFKTTLVTKDSAADVCRERGYLDQVRAYVQLYQQATQCPHVHGAILFTSSQVIVGLESDLVS